MPDPESARLDALFCMLCGFARALGAEWDAEDYAQETIHRFREWSAGVRNPEAWARRVLRNLMYNAGRRKQACALDEIDGKWVCYEHDPADESHRNELVDAVRRAVKELPVKLRGVVEMRGRGYKFGKIGEELGITEAAARGVYKTARRKLRRKLSAWRG